MADKTFTSLSDCKEPAHPMVVKLHDDLIKIYNRIRDKYQLKIDNMFDKVSRQIGYVVTTTLPVNWEAQDPDGEPALPGRITIGAEHLKGTLFERELSTIFKEFEAG